MNPIPVIFAIDKNVVMQCGVTITSLLKNANEGTLFDVRILYNEAQLNPEDQITLKAAFSNNDRLDSMAFVNVGEAFKEAGSFTTGHITTATYYRLLIPELFPEFDRVIYSDIDIIYQQDLSDIFTSTLRNGELIAAVLDLAINDDFYFQSDLPAKIGKSVKNYFNAGFLIMDLKRMREEGIIDQFKEKAKLKFDQNDQDILNIVCHDRVQILPSLYNFQVNHFSNYMWGKEDVTISFDRLFKSATLHYTWKHKPWNSLECVASDTWWHYYKMSPFYDDRTYFYRQYEQIEASRNDYRQRSNGQLFRRILVNIKHQLFK